MNDPFVRFIVTFDDSGFYCLRRIELCRLQTMAAYCYFVAERWVKHTHTQEMDDPAEKRDRPISCWYGTRNGWIM